MIRSTYSTHRIQPGVEEGKLKYFDWLLRIMSFINLKNKSDYKSIWRIFGLFLTHQKFILKIAPLMEVEVLIPIITWIIIICFHFEMSWI